MKSIITKSPEQTKKLGESLAAKLEGGEIIGLIGNLGGGKTVFTKGVANGLGIKQNITSPTFVIWRIYKIPKRKRIRYLCHVDLYRISKPNEFLALGTQEYWQRPDTVFIIEWAEKIKKYFPRKAHWITFEIVDKNARRIIIR